MEIPEGKATPEQMRAWAALVEATAHVQRATDRRLRLTIGLTTIQFEVLALIAEAPGGGLRMMDIADKLVVSRSGLTYQVSQLEKRGFVMREPSQEDERAVIARITDAGRAVVREGAPYYADTVKRLLLDRLRPEDLVTISDILGAVRPAPQARTLHPGATG